jgi:hypothetical protein
MQHRLRRHRHVGVDVVPGLRQPGFVERVLIAVAHVASWKRRSIPMAGAEDSEETGFTTE